MAFYIVGHKAVGYHLDKPISNLFHPVGVNIVAFWLDANNSLPYLVHVFLHHGHIVKLEYLGQIPRSVPKVGLVVGLMKFIDLTMH